MRSIRRLIPYLSLALACSIFVALVFSARVHAAPGAGGAVGGDWQGVSAPSLTGQRITALLPNGRDGMWVGSEERGLAEWDGEKWRTYGPHEGLPDSRVVALFLDQQGRLWVSTGGGLGYIPAGAESFHPIALRGLRSLPILAFAQGADGSILLGSAKGLDRWRADGGLQRVPELDGLAVLALHADRKGVIWAGTPAGLWRATDGKWEREPSAGDGRVAALAESADGQLYAAGETGLWQEQAGGWRKVPGPAGGDVTAIAARDGIVWQGTAQGLVAQQGAIWEVYTTALLPEPRVTAMAWSGDGALWVGTAGGLATYRRDLVPPRVAILGVNGLQPEWGSVRLATDSIDRLQIEAADLVTPPNRLRIFTRLEGVDPAPRELSRTHMQDLTSLAAYSERILPPGSHVLRVWAQDEAFNRSAESQVSVIVPALAHVPGGLTFPREAAFAATGGLALLLTAGATAGAARRIRRIQAEQAALVTVERVRAATERSFDLYSERLPLREGEVGAAVAALENRNVLLLGHRGMGKTAVLEQIALALPAASDRSALVAGACLDLATVREPELFYALMTAAADALYPFAAGQRPRLLWN
jgi:hypothetical protein